MLIQSNWANYFTISITINYNYIGFKNSITINYKYKLQLPIPGSGKPYNINFAVCLGALPHRNLTNFAIACHCGRESHYFEFCPGDNMRDKVTSPKRSSVLDIRSMWNKTYRKGISIRQAPVFRHLRALRKSPWKFINFMNELWLHCMLLVSYIQQYFNTSITVLTNQVWKLLIALFKVPNTGALTVLMENCYVDNK